MIHRVTQISLTLTNFNREFNRIKIIKKNALQVNTINDILPMIKKLKKITAITVLKVKANTRVG